MKRNLREWYYIPKYYSAVLRGLSTLFIHFHVYTYIYFFL